MISALVLLMGQFVLASLLFIEIPSANKDIYNVGVGNIWSMANLIAAYYFTKEHQENVRSESTTPQEA